ncbi:MAG: hypothetical protein KA035_01490 [Candidatus Levybacteria bacterium]|nr:hypothetical protein [Candidatus Levybacteria bacterium]
MSKQNEKSGGNAKTVAAAGAGAVVGAGVAVAATIALKNPKTRKKILSTLEDMKDRTIKEVPAAIHKLDSNKKALKTAKKVEKKAKSSVKKALKDGAKGSSAVVN